MGASDREPAPCLRRPPDRRPPSSFRSGPRGASSDYLRFLPEREAIVNGVIPGAGAEVPPARHAPGVHERGLRPALWLVVILVAVALIGAVAGCGRVENTSIGVPPNTILIDNFSFVPGGVVVRPESTITVINQGATTHTVTAVDKLFDSGPIAPGQHVTITAPAVPGKYRYLCMVHPYITGFVSVIAPDSPPGQRFGPR
jgi:plastocyanin